MNQRHLAPKGVQALQISHAPVLLDVLFGLNSCSPSRRHTKYSSLLRAPHHTAASVPFTVQLTLFAGVLFVVLLRILVLTNNFLSLEWTGGTNQNLLSALSEFAFLLRNSIQILLFALVRMTTEWLMQLTPSSETAILLLTSVGGGTTPSLIFLYKTQFV